jgi:hypothetical protein
LFGYQFSVEFKPGQQNIAANVLSLCHEEDVTIHALSIPNFDLLDQFHVEVATLLMVNAKHIEITVSTARPEWALVDDLVVQWGCSSFQTL